MFGSKVLLDVKVLTLEITPWSVVTLIVRVSPDVTSNLSATYPIIHAVTVPSEAGAKFPSLVVILENSLEARPP